MATKARTTSLRLGAAPVAPFEDMGLVVPSKQPVVGAAAAAASTTVRVELANDEKEGDEHQDNSDDEDAITIKRSHSGDRYSTSSTACGGGNGGGGNHRRRTSSSAMDDMGGKSSSASYGLYGASSDSVVITEHEFLRQQQHHQQYQQRQQQQHQSYQQQPYYFEQQPPQQQHMAYSPSQQNSTSHQYQMWQYQQYLAAYSAQPAATTPPYTVYAQGSPTASYQLPQTPTEFQPHHHPPGVPQLPIPAQAIAQSRSRGGSGARSNISPNTHHKVASSSPQYPTNTATTRHFTFDTESESDVHSSLLSGTSQNGYGSVRAQPTVSVPDASIVPSSTVPLSSSSLLRTQPQATTATATPFIHFGSVNAASASLGPPIQKLASVSNSSSGGGRLPPSRANSIGSIKHTEAAPAALHSISPLRGGGRRTSAHRRAISDGDRRMAMSTSSSSIPLNRGRGQQQLPMDPSRTAARRKAESANSATMSSYLLNHAAVAAGSIGNRWRSHSDSNSPKMGRPPKTASPGGSVAGTGSSNGGMGSGTAVGHHRRGSSVASVGALSFMSEASMTSIVSNIRKSVFFNRVQEKTGRAQLCFPLSKVHLIAIENPTDTAVPPAGRSTVSDVSNPYRSCSEPPIRTIDGYPLQLGRLYKVPTYAEEFEEYHRVAEDISGAMLGGCTMYDYDDLNMDLDDNRHCRCDCPHCVACVHRTGAVLPANYFCLTIEDSIYRRLLDDVCASQGMPCGLYFCGHHEDVSRPSIAIAICFLTMVFVAMGTVAIMF